MIAVNLSPRQFRQKNLAALVEVALKESGLLARNLEIEITEHTLMSNSAATKETLMQLRKLGVKIAIDDFGTGFSSFSYLLQYEVDRLKIDRSFVNRSADDPNAAAIVRAIISMAHGLNLKVVAEGVETNGQLDFLLRRRCDEAQGFYFGKAVPAGMARESARLIQMCDGDADAARDDRVTKTNSAQTVSLHTRLPALQATATRKCPRRGFNAQPYSASSATTASRSPQPILPVPPADRRQPPSHTG